MSNIIAISMLKQPAIKPEGNLHSNSAHVGIWEYA